MNETPVSEEKFSTERLLLEPLSQADAAFIYDLVNTEGWIRFIGDRNVHSKEDATAYVKRIQEKVNLWYWTVRLKDTGQPVGIVTFIKRDYLPHHDLGFAFLPHFTGRGFAYEAAKTVLRFVVHSRLQKTILATTLPANTASIKLLKKLGFRFQKEILVEDERLHIYSLTADDVLITEATQ